MSCFASLLVDYLNHQDKEILATPTQVTAARNRIESRKRVLETIQEAAKSENEKKEALTEISKSLKEISKHLSGKRSNLPEQRPEKKQKVIKGNELVKKIQVNPRVENGVVTQYIDNANDCNYSDEE